MKLRLIRHATLWIEYGGVRFLLDPMFSPKESNPPISMSANDRRNPLVDLPMPVEELAAPDALIVTHLHRDHWDTAAAETIAPSTPVFTQPGAEKELTAAGFPSVTPVCDSLQFRNVTLSRTGGEHGTGPTALRMGQVSGFVLQAEGEPTLYVAGDTIWCEPVKQALDRFRPDVTVVNAGSAQFITGGPITMDSSAIAALCRHAPYTQAAAVHLDAINHCLETRGLLRERMKAEGLAGRVAIPEDGEWLEWPL